MARLNTSCSHLGELFANAYVAVGVLKRAILMELSAFDGPKVIYAEACLLGPDRLSPIK